MPCIVTSYADKVTILTWLFLIDHGHLDIMVVVDGLGVVDLLAAAAVFVFVRLDEDVTDLTTLGLRQVMLALQRLHRLVCNRTHVCSS